MNCYKTPFGDAMLGLEKTCLRSFLKSVSRDGVLLSLGHPAGHQWLSTAGFGQSIMIHPRGVHAYPSPSCQALLSSLPLHEETVDLAVLSHVLEYESRPREVINEVCRVLKPEGQMVVLGFNPMSLLGLQKRFAQLDPDLDRANAVAPFRLRRWLRRLDGSIQKFQTFLYRPYYRSLATLKKLEFIEHVGSYCWPGFGDVYLLVFKKQKEGMSALTAPITREPVPITKGCIEPTIRGGS